MTSVTFLSRVYQHTAKLSDLSDQDAGIGAQTCSSASLSLCDCMYTRDKRRELEAKDNRSFSDDEIDKVVMLRMNRDFMAYMRTNYTEVIHQVCAP